MTNTTLAKTETRYSNKEIFHLIEEFFIGRKSNNIGRMIQGFHPKIEFEGIFTEIPIRGITSLEHKMTQLLEETKNFYFNLWLVGWDEGLRQGNLIVEYEYNDINLKTGYHIREFASFRVTEKLISHYIGLKEIKKDWGLH